MTEFSFLVTYPFKLTLVTASPIPLVCKSYASAFITIKASPKHLLNPRTAARSCTGHIHWVHQDVCSRCTFRQSKQPGRFKTNRDRNTFCRLKMLDLDSSFPYTSCRQTHTSPITAHTSKPKTGVVVSLIPLTNFKTQSCFLIPCPGKRMS